MMEIRDYEYVLIPNILVSYKCSLSGECCKNKWKIDINKEAFERTEKKLLELKEDIGVYIEKNENDVYSTKFSKGYCKFITEDGLCRIHKDFGWHCLSDTCKVYPRILKLTSRGVEIGLVFSCTSSAKLLLTDKKFEILKLHKKDYFFMNPNEIDFLIPENNLDTKINSRYYELESFFINIVKKDEDIWKKLSYLKTFIEKNLDTTNAANIDFGYWEENFDSYDVDEVEIEEEDCLMQTIFAKSKKSPYISNEFYNLIKINKLTYDLKKDRDFFREEQSSLNSEDIKNLKKLWNEKYNNILNNYILCLIFNKDMYYNLDYGFFKIVILSSILKVKILLSKSYLKKELEDSELVQIIKDHDNNFSHNEDFFSEFYTEKETRENVNNYLSKMLKILHYK